MRRLLLTLCMTSGLAWAPSAGAGEPEGLAAYQRKDWATASAELRAPAAEGHAAAQARLGHMLLFGLGVPRDDAEALRLLSSAAESNDPVGQFWLGTALQIGRGVPRDPVAAFDWLTRAAENGHPESLHALGEILFNGLDRPRDENRAVEYFRRAADKGVAASQEKMAEFLWNGRAMPVDRAQAVKYATAAARAGRPAAQFILGLAMATGDGTARDMAGAASWFRRAADQGHPQSMHNLGALLMAGNGLPRDLPEGYFWLALAAQRAPANLKATYERERDQIGARLPPEQQSQTRGRLAGWAPSGSAATAIPLPAPGQTATIPAPGQTNTVPRPPSGGGRGMSGSGFFVSRDGMVLTNAHVVEQCRSITVTPADGTPRPAQILARTESDDMAVLKTGLSDVDPARFREDRPLRSGDSVVVVGYPLSSLLSREANVTAGVISAMAGLRGDQRHYQITAPVQKGNSGGPLADMSGNVVGIVSSKLNAMKIAGQTGDLPQNINFAIKADLARRYLESNAVRFETAASTQTLSVADVGERIKRVTVFIECRLD
jgi:TPR repeat protein